jgi:hypothetical protein
MIRRVVVRWSIERALNLACLLGLLALAVMVAPLIWPKPILIVASMSVAQGLGLAAFLLFGMTVAVELLRARPHPTTSTKP